MGVVNGCDHRADIGLGNQWGRLQNRWVASIMAEQQFDLAVYELLYLVCSKFR